VLLRKPSAALLKIFRRTDFRLNSEHIFEELSSYSDIHFIRLVLEIFLKSFLLSCDRAS
jgi:hypothetical protein